MATIRPKDGEYAVIDSRWSYNRYDVRKIIKLTEQMYFYNGEGTGKERRARLDEIIFSSPDEAACKRVSERLVSSDAIREDEERSARANWELRRESIIGNAYAQDARPNSPAIHGGENGDPS